MIARGAPCRALGNAQHATMPHILDMISLTPGLQSLFDRVNAPDREVRRLCAEMVVTSGEVNAYISLGWCKQLAPYECRVHAIDYKPKDFHFTPKNLALIKALRGGKVSRQEKSKFAIKLKGLFAHRTCLRACMLSGPDLPTWHLLYFTQRDQAGSDNHWKEGPHVHYVRGRRDGRVTADQVWERICSTPPDPPSGEHIRCIDPPRQTG